METATLAELSVGGKGRYGIGASAVPFDDNLYRYLRITDINDDGSLSENDPKSVNEENATDYLLKPNDMVFARTGASVGRNYFYDGTDGPLVFAGFLIKFSIDPEKVNPKYVKYYCLSEEYRGWVQGHSTGSTRGNINEKTFSQLEIPLLSRPEQDAVVSILESLTHKIVNNNRINKNLEQQAQTLFAEYYYLQDCDPIPKGWSPVTLGDVVYISKETFNPSKQPETMLEHYSIPAFDETRYPVFELSTGIKSNKFIVDS